MIEGSSSFERRRAALAPREVEPLARGDVREAGAMLGRAFGDDPMYLAILPFLTTAERHRAVEHANRGFVHAAVRHQVAEGIRLDGRLVAASLVCAPGQYPVGWSAKLWQASGCAKAGPRAGINYLRYDAFVARRHLREPHFYLFVLGVEPDQQGRGLGKALLRRLSERADRAGLPCFLETDGESNVALYRSVGYEIVGEEPCTELGGVKVWFMRRPPAA